MRIDVNKLNIEALDISTLVSIVREPNMCSGGYETIRTIVKECNLRHDAKMLEIGSNTGFSSIEFASIMPHAKVIGIDINSRSVELAKNKANTKEIHNVEFLVADATKLDFPDNEFDLVFCNNATSFIDEKEQAVEEYIRVLKSGGYLVAVPVYYRETPPKSIVKAVEKAINAEIDHLDRSFWENSFKSRGLQEYFVEDYKYVKSSQKKIDDYTEMVMSQEHLSSFSSETRERLKNRLRYLYNLFDENLQYAGYSIMIYRLNPANPEPILHSTCKI